MKPELERVLDQLPEAKEFLKHLKVEARYSPTTIYGYGLDLIFFFRFLSIEAGNEHFQPKPVNTITKSDIRDFLTYLDSDKHYKDRSLYRKICVIRSFFKFLLQEGLITDNPSKTIKTPKIEKSIPVFMDDEEYLKFLDSPDNIRDKLILRILLATGMRVSELEALNIDHIDQTNKTVKIIKGKGKKQRIVDIDPDTIAIMREYIEKERVLINPEGENLDALFLNREKSRLNKRTIQRLVKKYREKAGIKKPITPHKCRHTTGRLLLEGGMDIRVIQEEFGHKSLSTTEIYTKVTDEHRTKAYKDAHPFYKHQLHEELDKHPTSEQQDKSGA